MVAAWMGRVRTTDGCFREKRLWLQVAVGIALQTRTT